MISYRYKVIAAGFAAAMALSGCQRSTSALDLRRPPEPLSGQPVGTVDQTSLDPLQGGPTQLGQGVDPNSQGGNGQQTQVASVDPSAGVVDGTQDGTADGVVVDPVQSASATPVTRESMAGTWTVATDNPECRIILAFTKWSGGYRAATRRCNAPELAGVTAWDVKDNRVVLVDGGGSTVATLNSTGAERYDGSTNGGKRISFTR